MELDGKIQQGGQAGKGQIVKVGKRRGYKEIVLQTPYECACSHRETGGGETCTDSHTYKHRIMQASVHTIY